MMTRREFFQLFYVFDKPKPQDPPAAAPVKEEPMPPVVTKQPKKQITFKYDDGKKVSQLAGSGLFTIKNPVDRHVPAGGVVALKLGVTCLSHPLDIFAVKSLADIGFEIVEGLGKRDAADPIVVALRNRTTSVCRLAEGDSVLRAFALDNSDLEIVEG